MEFLVENVIVVALLLLVPAWQIFRRAGLHPALSLLIFVPVAGPFIALLVLAICRWPNLETRQ